MDINKVLQNWAKAHRLADENPRLLIEQWSPEVSNLCAQRMKDLDKAEAALFALSCLPDLPIELVRYICATVNFEKCSCHLKAYRQEGYHAACAARGQVYFETREALNLSINL